MSKEGDKKVLSGECLGEVGLQAKQPEIEDSGNWGEGTRKAVRKRWQVIESNYDPETESGTIRYRTNGGQNGVYEEQWVEGTRSRLRLVAGEHSS